MAAAKPALQKRQLQAQQRLQQQGEVNAVRYMKNLPPRQDQPYRDMSPIEQQQSAQNQ